MPSIKQFPMLRKAASSGLWLLLMSLWSACTLQPLNVFSTYLTPESRASYFLGTPDPFRNQPHVGQRLYVNWRIAPSYLNEEPVQLHLHLRFRNRQQIEEVLPLSRAAGTYVYQLLNEDYFDTGGLATYKIEIRKNDQILHEWRHLMWVNLITFEHVEEAINPD